MLQPLAAALGIDVVVKTLNEVRKIVVSNQEKLTAIATQLGGIQTHFAKGLAEVRTEIDRLRNQAPEELDFGPVEAALTNLQTGASALDEIVPDEIEAEEPEQGAGTGPETPVPSTPGTDEPAPAQPGNAEDEEMPADSENPSK